MRVSDLTVEVRNASLARVGQILPTDLVGLELALRFNKVGAWRITLRSDHPLVDTLRLPGSGLIVTGPNGVLISGPTVAATQSKTAQDPTGTWEIIGTDDSVVLGQRLAYPVPTTADLSLQSSAYDSRSGNAETVAKAYVSANIGASAPAARKISALTVGADQARGSSVVVNARFDKLGELVYGVLTPSNLGFGIQQSGSALIFDVYAPTDRSAYIRMDVDNLRLSRSEYTYTAPGATRVIVAGRGQGAARTLVERVTTASTFAESTWGRRIEVFKDQRNTNDTTELNTAGDEILAAQGLTIEGIKVTPSDDLASMQYGVDWGLGDKVTVVVGSAEVAKIVTEVAIVVAQDGVRIGATVGDPDVAAADTTSTLVSGQTDQEARISNLERNESSGSVAVADGSITTAKLSDSSVTSAKIVDGTIVDADISATAAIAPSKVSGTAVVSNDTRLTPAGALIMFAGTAAPSGWLLCDGSVVSQSTYASLFSVVGSTYNTGGEGAGNFRLPDLRGRVPVGRNAGTFSTLGATGGAETVTLTTAQMPSHSHANTATTDSQGGHSHTVTVSGGAHTHILPMSASGAPYGVNDKPLRASGSADFSFRTDFEASGSNYGSGSGTHTHSTSVSTNGAHTHNVTMNNASAGGDGAHNNLQPYQVLNYIIKT